MAQKKTVPVSVIVPCYRCSSTIERAVLSIYEQTVLPAEVILVDDASPESEGTIEKLFELQQRFGDLLNIKIFELRTNRGPAYARNYGWEKASQKYIAFLDADDAWHPVKLDLQCRFMEENPSIALTGHHNILIGEDELSPDKMEKWTAFPVKKGLLLLSNRFPTSTVMLKRELSQRFKCDKCYSEDYLLWLQIVLGGKEAWVMKIPLTYIYKARYGASGLSAQLTRMELGELETYYQLYKDKHLSLITCILISGFSVLKYFRRILISMFRI